MKIARLPAIVLVGVIASAGGTLGTSVTYVELRDVNEVRIVCNAFGLPEELADIRTDAEKQALDLLSSGGMSATIVDEGANFPMRVGVEKVNCGGCEGYLVEVWVSLTDEVEISRIPKGQRGRNVTVDIWSSDRHKVVLAHDVKHQVTSSIDEMIAWFLEERERARRSYPPAKDG